MSKRIYLVAGKHLVRAHSPAGARNHVASKTMTSELAKQETLVEMLSDGAKVEDAGAEQAEAFESGSAGSDGIKP